MRETRLGEKLERGGESKKERRERILECGGEIEIQGRNVGGSGGGDKTGAGKQEIVEA